MAQGLETKKPVVIVTINYRLGIFGFGYGAEIAANNAANLGLKDAIASLQWVQDNIKAFGGNPNEVTVFGESAGAILISLMYLNPGINLFRSAIMESGAQSTAPIGPTSSIYQGPYDATVKFANCTVSNGTASGNQSTFECLKALPAFALLNATLATLALPEYAGFIFAPSVDGGIIPDDPHTLLSEGKFAKHPYISGNNLDEGTLFTPTYINSTALITLALDVEEPIPPNMTVIDEVLTLYPDDPSFGSPFNTGNQTFGLSTDFKRAAAILGDSGFQANRRWFLSNANKYGLTKTWSYLFTAPTPGAPPYLGVAHGSEVVFVFGAVGLPGSNYSSADVALSEQMINYWLTFAYYTDPSAGGNNSTYWPSYGTNQTMLQLNPTNITLITDTYRQKQINYFLSEPNTFNFR